MQFIRVGTRLIRPDQIAMVEELPNGHARVYLTCGQIVAMTAEEWAQLRSHLQREETK